MILLRSLSKTKAEFPLHSMSTEASSGGGGGGDDCEDAGKPKTE